MKKFAILSSLLLLALNSCTNEEIFNEEILPGYEKRITVVAEDLVPAEGTRTSYTDNGNGYSFAWTEGDALGIFPTNGHQTDFPIGEDGVGSNTAVFDGGDWALKPNAKYAAYYPLIHDFDLDLEAIPIDYTGQVQTGNGSTAHLSKYDFMASTFTEVDAKGNVNFHLQHLGCLVQFNFTMPKVDTFSKVKITSDNTEFITEGTFDLTADEPAITTTKTSKSFYVDLQNVTTTADNQELTINAMFAPVDLNNSTLSVVVYGSDNMEYLFRIEGKDLTQGTVSKNSKDEISFPYVTFKAEAEQTLRMSKAVPTIEYSVNNGAWTELGTDEVTFGGNNGDLRLRGKSSYGTSPGVKDGDNSTFIFSNNTLVSASGDIRTLVDWQSYANTDCRKATFYSLFDGCSVLTTAPDLPATNLSMYCYLTMFRGCTSLATAPDLPATTLSIGCYRFMFEGCTSLETAPELPATNLASSCYYGMFWGCAQLTTAPELSATTLANNCYNHMFYGCTSLTTAPELPATNLVDYSYEYMFYGCTSLTTAPELPATNLVDRCYHGMFWHCTSLETAPELPAINLKKNCYEHMFSDCTSLETAPELPATILTYGCYDQMFSGCTSLSYVKMLATDISATSCLNNWLTRVASTGTFVKNKDAEWNVMGSSGIPEGWNVKKVDENGNIIDDTPYVTFHAETEQVFSMFYEVDINGDCKMPFIESLQYSVDGGDWATVGKNTDWMGGTNTITFGGEYGDLRLRGKSKIGTAIVDPDFGDRYQAVIRFHKDNVKVSSSGDIRTLVDYENYVNADMTEARFCNLFGGCQALTSAPELPSTTLAEYCYYGMFNGCISLTNAPELPAPVLSESCYYNMFSGCTSLTKAPDLYAETLAPRCYTYMFAGCTSLASAPILPAPVLSEACYSNMFNGCKKLAYIKMMATDVSASFCLVDWLSGVSTTGTFVKNSAATWNITGASGIPSGWTETSAAQ